MTKQTDLDKGAGDRPALEIEVTEEMIEAGVIAFAGYDQGWESLPDRLRAAFKAMAAEGLTIGSLNMPAAVNSL